jgi:tetratricopeptide (TPR) repeat protein
VDHYGFAVGIDLPAANRARALEALFQVLWHSGGAMTYTWYGLVDFGSHREERYARRKAERLNTAPSLLYNRALELFYDGEYWDAYFALARVRTEFPDFFKNDWVDLYAGRCLEELDMSDAAIELYERTQDANPRSVILPLIDLGLMRAYYRRGVAGGVREQFKRIRDANAPDSLTFHACYLWGQSNMHIGQYHTAHQALDLVPQTHPEYLFAQYSAGVACVELGKPADALQHLLNVSSAVPSSEAEEELRHKSAVMIGYLFLEELQDQPSVLAKTVAALRSVPSSSMFYAEAQLALGWAALRAQNWADCLDAGSETMRAADDPVLKAEGGLLVGYARFYQKNYRGARKVLEPISESLDELADIPRQPPHLRAETQHGYDSVAQSMLFLADKMQSPHVVGMIDSLRREKERFQEGLDEYRRHRDLFARHQLHAKRFDKLRTDVDFILAKAISFAATRKSIELIEEAQDRTEAIEQQIRLLQQQIRSLKNNQ